MKDYKGLMVIHCKVKKCIMKKPLKQVEPGCVNCEKMALRVIDLEGKTVAALISKKPIKKE